MAEAYTSHSSLTRGARHGMVPVEREDRGMHSVRMAAAGLMALTLGACAQQPPGTAAQPDAGATMLAAVSEPFLIVAKIPVCALTLVAAGPIGAAAQLTDPASPLGHDVKQGLVDGINENCGPPFSVAP
jgi:hypothetical protein